MAPRGGNSNRAGAFLWTDERKAYLLECWHSLLAANEARGVNKFNRKQIAAELRILFCARYPECKYVAATLYNRARDTDNDRPLSVSTGASKSTAFWNAETDDFLIECVAQAHEDNARDIRLGLLAGKRGRQSKFRSILIDLFARRYPNVPESSIFRRVTHLRKQNRIDGEGPQQPSSAVTGTLAIPLSPTSAVDNSNSHTNADAGGDVSVSDQNLLYEIYQCAMRHWEIGFQFACQPMFVAACSFCSAIMTADSTKTYRKFLQDPVNIPGGPPLTANVYKYYTKAQVKLPVSNANGQWYRCILCNRIDLLAQYPLAPDTVRNLPVPQCVSALTDPADRRSIALVALHSRTATQRSDALRVFEHLRGEFAVSHQNDKRYFDMYAMIVDRYAQYSAATSAGNARILVQRALKWMKTNNPLYRMFAANYETLLRYQPRQPGQPKTLQLFGNVDFKPVSMGLTKISLLDSEQSGMIVPAGNVGTRGVPSVTDIVTGAQHVRNFDTATRGHADVCQVTFGDPHLEAKLFPWLFPYGTGGWSVHDGKRGITRGMYIRWRTSMCDQRFRREPEYMFFFLDLIIKERMQYYASVRVNVANLDAPLTRQQIDTAAKRAKNDPYVLQYGTEVPASIPNSRNYWATKTLDLLAISASMGRQPDFFITLTENDSWPELQAVICRGLAASHQYADRKELEDVHRFGRPAMNHPVETVHAFYNRLQMFRRRVLNNPKGPIGNVQDYFLRIEYQKRGSLHAHLVVWVEPGTIVPEDVVSAEMPRYNDHPMNPTWRHIVESYQLHRCIPRRCLKGKKNQQLTRCKYGFPFAVNCASVHPAATGIRYVYKRHDAEDARVIPYNLPLLLLWDGHINIQMVTSGGWELYLAKYVVKSDQATMMSIHSTKATNECETYLKGRLVSLLEAATLIQQRPHVMSTREVVYLPVASAPQYRILKRRADMQNLNENDTNLYYDTKLEKYLDRPRQLNHLTYPQFYEQYYYNTFQNDNEVVVGCNDEDGDDADAANADGEGGPEQNNVEGATRIVLKDRKGRTLRKRQNRLAVVRFPHFSPYGANLEMYCLVKLLRHVPVDRVTFDELKTRTGSYLQECLDRNLIEATDEATHFLESAAKQGFSLDRLREIAARLIAGNWLADQDVDKLLETVAPYHMHADKVKRGLITDDADGYDDSDIAGGGYGDDDSGLNGNVRKYLPVSDYVQAFTPSQLGAFQHITDAWNENQQVLAFITGGGGVGKSFLLDGLVAYCNENGRTVQKLATTGCAAHLIGGVTIHSYLRMGPELISRIERGTTDAYLLERTQVLFIDEVSMLEQRVMEKFEYYITLFSSATANDHNNTSSVTASKNTKQPMQKVRFAGKSIIMFGDPCQLPPIGRHIWQPLLLRGFHVMVLKEAVRQRDDHGFADMLQRIRLAQPTPEDIEILRSRLITDEQLRDIDVTGRGGLILFPLRRQKDAMNALELAKLPLQGERMYLAQDGHVDGEGSLPKKVRDYIAILDGKNKLMPQCVRLRMGARVMLLKNRNVPYGWVNGKIAIVDSMSDNYVVISDPGKPQRRLVVHRLRQDIPYPYADGQYFREQFPLDLAYGVTIHKSQGQTLDVVAVSAEGLNNSGQFYTAISRARELDGLYLLAFEIESIYLYPDIRALIQWFNVVDCLVRNNDDDVKPDMPTVGQLTYRPGGCIIKPAQPVISSAKAVKRPRLNDTTTAMPPPPPPPPPPAPVLVVVDESNVESFVRDALHAISSIPITLPLHEYVSAFNRIATQHTWTQQWMDEIAHRQRCHYDSRNPTFVIDQGRTDRFYDLFAEQQGYIIATEGDNSCLFHAFSMVLYGHQRHDKLFRFLCCIIFARYYNYYNDRDNCNHFECVNVRTLIHDTALSNRGERSWGGAAHLTAFAQIARRDVYVYNILIDVNWKHAPVLYLQEALDNHEMRGSMHVRYESRQPPFNNHQPLALLLSDAGSGGSHYSAILPLSAGTFLLKPVAVLPPHR